MALLVTGIVERVVAQTLQVAPDLGDRSLLEPGVEKLLSFVTRCASRFRKFSDERTDVGSVLVVEHEELRHLAEMRREDPNEVDALVVRLCARVA